MDTFVVVVFIIVILVIASKLITSDLSHIIKLSNELLGLDESTSKRFLHSLNASTAQNLINSFNPKKGADSQKFINFMIFYLLGSIKLNDFILLVIEIKKKGYDYKLSHQDFVEFASFFKTSNLDELAFERAKAYEDFVLSNRFTLVLGGAKLRTNEESSKNARDCFSENDLGISDLKNDTSITGIYRRESRLMLSETWQRVGWSIATKFNDKLHLVNLEIAPSTEIFKAFYEDFFTLPDSDYYVFISEEMILTDDEEASLPEECIIRIFDRDKNIVYKTKAAIRYTVDDLTFMLSNNNSQLNKLLKILKSSHTLFFEIRDNENLLMKFELDENRSASAAISSIQGSI